MWKERLISEHPEWEYYYKAFDCYLEYQKHMDTFDKLSKNSSEILLGGHDGIF